MGCDIHASVEVFYGPVWLVSVKKLFPLDFPWLGETFTCAPFHWRSYDMFGFLADVRNYSRVPPISEPRGWPEDTACFRDRDADDWDYHSRSWLSLKELIEFDYDREFEDRRYDNGLSGAALTDPGRGIMTTFRKFLGPQFFRDIELMKTLAPDPAYVRIVFAFDN